MYYQNTGEVIDVTHNGFRTISSPIGIKQKITRLEYLGMVKSIGNRRKYQAFITSQGIRRWNEHVKYFLRRTGTC